MTVVAYIDALLPLLPVPDGWQKDDSASIPPILRPNRLYLGPNRLAPQRLDELDGVWAEAMLSLRCVLAAMSKGETRVQHQERSVSKTLDDAVDTIVRSIDSFRTRTAAPRWWNIYVSAITYDAQRSIDVRAHYLDIVVRMVPPPELS